MSRLPSVQAHVAYKPVVPAEPRKSQEWFPLPSMFKLCNHERPVVEDSPTGFERDFGGVACDSRVRRWRRSNAS